MAMYKGHEPGVPSKVVPAASHVVPPKQATTGKGLRYTRAGVEERVKRGGSVSGGKTRANVAHPVTGSIGKAMVK